MKDSIFVINRMFRPTIIPFSGYRRWNGRRMKLTIHLLQPTSQSVVN